jgi:hypothetical protein
MNPFKFLMLINFIRKLAMGFEIYYCQTFIIHKTNEGYGTVVTK